MIIPDPSPSSFFCDNDTLHTDTSCTNISNVDIYANVNLTQLITVSKNTYFRRIVELRFLTLKNPSRTPPDAMEIERLFSFTIMSPHEARSLRPLPVMSYPSPRLGLHPKGK